MAKIVGQESPSKNTQILYRRSRKVSNAISTVVNIHSSRNRRARFALERKIRRDNKRLGRSTIMVDDHGVNDGEVSALQWRCLTESDCNSSSFHGTNVLINGFLEIARPGKSNPMQT